MNKPEADSQRVHDLQCMEIWNYSSLWLSEDDRTLIVIKFTKERRTPGLLEKLGGYIKVVRRDVIS